ncbi:MAG: hypothetical protein ACUVTF_05435, partial [bacterium]
NMSKARLGIMILFAVLFLPQCITVPAMYENAEAKQEKRRGVSVQYGEGSYKGLCASTRYYYKYAGARVDYARSKRFSEAIEAGYEIGGSIIGYNETSDDTLHINQGALLQVDARPAVKIVTPTKKVRLGLKIAPGLLFYGGIAHKNTGTDIGGELFSFSYASLLFGIGTPEFLTMSLNVPFYFCAPFPYPYIGLTHHYKNTSFSACVLIPHFTNTETETPSYFLSIGFGWHY